MTVFAVVFLTVSALCFSQVDSAEKYTNKFDSIDVSKVLKSDRLLTSYTNCLLEKGPCPPPAAELRRHLPDALQTDCSKCTDTQKTRTKQVYNYLIANKPDIWKSLEAKYDPTGEFKARELRKRNNEKKSLKS